MTNADLKIKLEKTVYRGWDGRQDPRELWEATLLMWDGVEWSKVESHFYATEETAAECGIWLKQHFLDARSGKNKYHFKEVQYA